MGKSDAGCLRWLGCKTRSGGASASRRLQSETSLSITIMKKDRRSISATCGRRSKASLGQRERQRRTRHRCYVSGAVRKASHCSDSCEARLQRLGPGRDGIPRWQRRALAGHFVEERPRKEWIDGFHHLLSTFRTCPGRALSGERNPLPARLRGDALSPSDVGTHILHTIFRFIPSLLLI